MFVGDEVEVCIGVGMLNVTFEAGGEGVGAATVCGTRPASREASRHRSGVRPASSGAAVCALRVAEGRAVTLVCGCCSEGAARGSMSGCALKRAVDG